MRLTRRSGLIASLITLALLIGVFAAPATTSAQERGANMIIVPPQAPQGPDTQVVLQLSGFAANESVTLWETFPDYTVLPRGNYSVNTAGVKRVVIDIDGSLPVGLHHFSAHGNESGILTIEPFEVLPPAVAESPGISIDVTTGLGGKQGGYFTFVGSGYQSRETVSLWLTLPDGTVEYLKTKRSHEGRWAASVSFDERDPTGQYYLTGFGNTSEMTGIATFFVTGGNFTTSSGGATLEASPQWTKQLETVQLHGEGFAPGEIVSIWITMSDGTVWNARKVLATDGSFTEVGYLPALIPDNGFPVGTTTFTAYGNSSQLIATATVELWAGSGL